MRVIETIHPNPQMRTFTLDQVISNVILDNYSKLIGDYKKATPEIVKLYEQLRDIPLISNDILLDKYSIHLKIEDAFENSEKDWSDIRQAVFYCLANFLNVDLSVIENAHSFKDDRKNYTSDVVNLFELHRIVSEVKIPHDFETHRAAWRNAIVIAKGMQEEADLKNSERIHDGPNVYWENELQKFDAAFDALLALKLPQS